MDKILTVVIPTYNMETYLRKCLDSLVVDDQELFDRLEVLVINDGSKDSSSSIAHEYQHRYPHVFRVIDKDNGNYGSCINRGLQEATGKYFKILDADDTFDTNHFTRFLFDLAKLDVDMIISDFAIVSGSDTIKRAFTYHLPPYQIMAWDKIENEIKNIAMHAVTYKCDNLRRINYSQTEGVSYSDIEYVFTPMTTVIKAYYFHKVVYRYLLGREGQTADLKIYYGKVGDRIKVTNNLLALFPKLKTKKYTNYLEQRLLSALGDVYFSCLVINRDDAELNRLDVSLIENKTKLYAMLDKKIVHKFLRCKYIKRWRNTGQLPPLYISWIYIIAKKMQKFVRERDIF